MMLTFKSDVSNVKLSQHTKVQGQRLFNYKEKDTHTYTHAYKLYQLAT